MKLEDIQQKIQNDKLPPSELARTKAELAGEYSFAVGQLEDILARKPGVWNKMRTSRKSDKATDRAWEATEDGINEVGLRWRIKRIEKLISAVNSLISVAEGEARNQW